MPKPSTYKSKYAEHIKEYMKDGSSLSSWCAEIGICRATAYVWMEDFPEFKDAYAIAKTRAQHFWEKMLKLTAAGKIKGNVAAQIFWLKNRFSEDWRDDHRLNVESDEGVSFNLNYKSDDL